MQLTSIPQIYRNVGRWTQILTVLSRYGLADWISQFDLDFAKGILTNPDGEALARQSREVRIRMALTDLGPTFVKLGQILSTRPDLVGNDLATELRALQDSVPADPPEAVHQTLESELGQPATHLFSEFDDVPFASASIGQVHRARLVTGEAVVVKVQHAGIGEKVRVDLEILAGLAQLAERVADLAAYRPSATVAEFQRMLLRELDYGREEQNLEQFQTLLAELPNVRVPKPFHEASTSRVLTMEVFDGIRLVDRQRLLSSGYDLDEIARTGAELYIHMIFTCGLYHADPHPGNIVILPGNVIGLLDFGMVGRIDERLREDMEEMLMALVQRDAEHLCNVITRVGHAPQGLDRSALRNDVAEFVASHAGRSLDQFDLSAALNEIMEIIRSHRIQLPAQGALLLKVLVMLEGTARLLSPKFSLIEVLQPMQQSILMRRLSPLRYLKKLGRLVIDLEQLAEILPRRAMEILDQISAGKFDIHLDHRRLGPSVNRLVLGLVGSALFLGSALMLAYKVPPLLFHYAGTEEAWFGLKDVSMFGLLGCFLSFLLGLRLFWAIDQSGNLDRTD